MKFPIDGRSYFKEFRSSEVQGVQTNFPQFIAYTPDFAGSVLRKYTVFRFNEYKRPPRYLAVLL